MMNRLTFVLTLFLSACSTGDPLVPDATKPHHTSAGFRNLYVKPKTHNFLEFQWIKLTDDTEWADYSAGAHRVPIVERPSGLPDAQAEKPTVTWLGHSTVLIQYRGISVLTDPIFSNRASPVSFAGPKRVTKPAVTIAQLPPIDFVVISHNHYDHLDISSVKQLGNKPTWLVPLRNKQWFTAIGIENVVEFDWWDEYRHDAVKVTATPSQHWTARTLFDRDKVLWAAWSFQIDDFKFWFAGDTGYNDIQFKQIGEKLGPFDLGIIPIGGYEPRWFMKDVHVNPEEAVEIHRDVRSRFSVGVHWGTFPLTAEPIDQPPQRLREATRDLQDSEFVPLAVGESRQVNLQNGS